MSEAAQTLDGWYCLHDFRLIDWASWKTLSSDERQLAISEFQGLLDKWNTTQSNNEGSHALYSIVGQKADFMLMFARPTMEELNAIENEFNKTKLAEYTIPAYSYVSVVELSNYLAVEMMRILTKTLMYVQDFIRFFHKRSMYASTQWTSVVKVMITGTCFLWKNAKA